MQEDMHYIIKKLEAIEDKVDHLKDRFHDVDKTLAAQHVTLLDHTRRSEINEKAVEIMREEFKPIRSHVTKIEGVVKFIGLVSLMITVLVGLSKLINISFLLTLLGVKP